jgi:hypothetical protein
MGRQAFYNNAREMMFSLLEGFGGSETGRGRDKTEARART